MLQYQHYEDIVNLNSQFQRCNNVVNTIFIAYYNLYLLSNVETMSEQCCNFDDVT